LKLSTVAHHPAFPLVNSGRAIRLDLQAESPEFSSWVAPQIAALH